MRKTLFFCGAVVALMISSCNGKKTEQSNANNDSVIQVVIADSIMPELDSLATVIDEVAGTSDIKDMFLNGSINLKEQQKKVKPDYLLTQQDLKDLISLQDKYVAEAYLAVDQTVAKLYNMDDDDFYANSMSRLASQTDAANEALAKKAKDAPLNLKNAKALYDEMKKRNRLDKFYVAEAAYVVEALWIVSNNKDLYMPAVDDAHAAGLCKHLAAALRGINLIAQNNPEMKTVADALQPLEGISSSTAGELGERIVALHDQVGEARKALLGKKYDNSRK